MLTSLFVQNVVLIDKLSLDFAGGLTVMTGETGAGKSIVLDALALALGARSDIKLIRVGADQLSVVASFELPAEHVVWAQLKEQGFDADGPELILKRTLSRDGKTKAFINDQPVSLSLLKTIGDQLVEIQGQFATHGLLNPATHLAVLDAYAGVDTAECARLYHAWKEAEKVVRLQLARMDHLRGEWVEMVKKAKDLKASFHCSASEDGGFSACCRTDFCLK